jgi:hypothetical protein
VRRHVRTLLLRFSEQFGHHRLMPDRLKTKVAWG